MQTELNASLPDSISETEQFYSDYYAKKGLDRNSLLHNPGVLFQVLAHDAAIVRAMQSIHPDSKSARVLDVGCGEGAALLLMLRLGFQPRNLFGVDIQEDRILGARARNSLIKFECADATRLPFEDATFDVVMESTMFIHATDHKLAGKIAAEMIRVTKPGGTLLLSDWRYGKPCDPHYKALTRKRIAGLFQIGVLTQLRGTFRGPLIPPIGRLLSEYCGWLFFAVQALLPFLAGHVVTTLRKNSR